MKTVQLSDSISVGNGNKLLLIAGPCQIESRDHAMGVAEKLAKITSKHPISFVFKSSYDKANRTSSTGARGIGLDAGLKILQEIRTTFKVPVLTDVHSPEEAQAAGDVVDVIQTPAFLCRQTDLLIAAGKTGRAVNIKKGQFLHPSDMQYAAEKVSATGNQKIFLCERGSCFGYRDLVVDMRGLLMMKETGYPVIFDGTHSVQSMGGGSGQSSGYRQYVLPLVKAAVSVGVDGLFIECHPDPENAPSDGKTMLPLSEMEKVIETICRIRAATV